MCRCLPRSCADHQQGEGGHRPPAAMWGGREGRSRAADTWGGGEGRSKEGNSWGGGEKEHKSTATTPSISNGLEEGNWGEQRPFSHFLVGS